MDLRPTDEQQQLIDAFAALYSNESTPERVRAAEPLGFDPALWTRLVDLGIVAMAVGEEQGGWGASLLDLELVAEQHGRHLASAPAIETQVAARLLARLGAPGEQALAGAIDGRRLVTLALRPSRRQAARPGAGRCGGR